MGHKPADGASVVLRDRRSPGPYKSAIVVNFDPGGTMLTVHHLGKSQSERIVWLCEELAIPYELKCYTRDAKTMLAPPEYKALHPIGAAPVITDGDLVLAESGAIVDYIMARYGKGRLTPPQTIPASRSSCTGFISPTARCRRRWAG